MQKLTLLVLVFLVWHYLPAQLPNAAFLHYNTDQGLSNDHITAIAKDKRGFLWIGTVNGLNRFDGRSFKIFRHDPFDKNSIPGNHILGITLAPDDWLWIATLNGLCKIDPLRLEVRQISLHNGADTLKNEIATRVGFDSRGMAWTTSNQGIHQLNSFSGDQVFFFKTEQKTLGWYMTLIDRQDRLWMVKETVRRFDPATKTVKVFKGANPTESFTDAGPLNLAQDVTGKIWAATWYQGLWAYEGGADEFVRCPPPPTLSTMLLADVSDSGKPFLWVGGEQSGLGVYYPDTKQFIGFKPDSRDPFTHNNYVSTAFFKDPANGDVWIGTEVGLEHYAPSAIRFGRAMIPVEKDMGQFSLVSSVVHDNTDPGGQEYFIAVWGTGLFAWNKTTGAFTRIKSARSKLAGGGIFQLFQDRRGYLWGCLHSGIGRYHPRTKEWRDYEKMFSHPERNNIFLCGLEDRQGNLWFGSNKEGLFWYNPRSDRVEPVFYSKEYANEPGYFNITGISEDTLGRLWLACNSGGLVRFDPLTGMSKRFNYTDRNISPVCNAVVAAGNGRIYATFYDAFLELDTEGKLLRYFTQQNKLKANRLFFVVEDRQGKIWFNTEHLLHYFDPLSGAFHYFGQPDGLFSNAVTDALSITPGGEIFIGFQNAFNFFYPNRLRRNLYPPPVAITSVKVMNKEREPGVVGVTSSGWRRFFAGGRSAKTDTVLTLRPGENFFEVEFAALNFNQQERNRYAYRLEGFNEDWVYTDRPVATFTNLDGGRYLLRMKAANNDGIWNEQGIALAIRVIPPFYKTWWFPVLLMLTAGALVAALLWYRRQQRRRLEIFRENLARDLHDEMGSALSSIRFFSDFASQQIGDDKPRIKSMLHRIGQSAGDLGEFMQDIVWAMKTRNDQLEDLAARMTAFGFHLLEARNMNFETHVSENFTEKRIRPEVRRNIYLIFKEAVNNAAKYSEATMVELHFALRSGWLFLIIKDNGKGFEPGTPVTTGGGNGLQNMRQRAADINGKLEVFSAPGAGARIELRVKI
ncbi:MAG: histidine kinase [Thermoanaerobaculia bacterium]|nr:histidine kinase [Thermoanaerobaculia bacterium]